MCRYRVIFFKSLLGIDGHPDKCLQQSIVIRRARRVERAVETAKCRYERRCHMWLTEGFTRTASKWKSIWLKRTYFNLSPRARGSEAANQNQP